MAAQPSKGSGGKRVPSRSVRILIFHGYLLGGTGSNVYNAALAEALVRAGHEVHLLCQDRDPLRARLGRRRRRLGLRRAGGARAPRAGAGHGLPPRHRRPAAALRRRPLRGDRGAAVPGAQRRGGRPLRGAQRGRRARGRRARAARRGARQPPRDGSRRPGARARGLGVPYAVKIHGSALEYTVKRDPRFMPYAREGLAGAGGVLVGSRHTAESLWEAMGDESCPGAPGSARPASTSAASRRASPRRRSRASRRSATAWAAGPRPPGPTWRPRRPPRSRGARARRRRRSPPWRPRTASWSSSAS